MIDLLGDFRFPLQSRQSIYDAEELSALELAGRTAAKMNEVVTALNGVLSSNLPVFYNVVQFGADASGLKDASGAINETLSKAGKNVVYIPDGDFLLNSPIRLDNDQFLWMSQNATLIRNWSGGGIGNATIQNRSLTGGNTNITIFGGIIKSKDSSKGGKHIGFQSVNGLTLVGIKVRGAYGDWMTQFRKCSNGKITLLDLDDIGTDLYTDGLHFTSCNNFNVSDCIVVSSDDCISLTCENAVDDVGMYNMNFNNMVLTTKKASVIKVTIFAPFWQPNTAYALNNRIMMNGRYYICTTAGVSSTVAPTHTSGSANDGSVVWKFDTTTTLSDTPPASVFIRDINFNNIVSKGGTLDAGISVWMDERGGSLGRISDININNMTIDNSRGAGSGMILTWVKEVYMNKVKLSNPQGTGIVATNADGLWLRKVKIVKPRATSANGITLDTVDNFELDGCHIELDPTIGNFGSALNVGIINGKMSRYGRITRSTFMNSNVCGINMQCCQGVFIIHNRITSNQNGIIETGESSYNYIEGNDVRGNVNNTPSAPTIARNSNTALYPTTANTTVVKTNIGFDTEKRNPFQLGSNVTSVTVTHGLAVQPSSSGIYITAMSSLGAAKAFWVDSITDTTFKLNVDVQPGILVNFCFYASAAKTI